VSVRERERRPPFPFISHRGSQNRSGSSGVLRTYGGGSASPWAPVAASESAGHLHLAFDRGSIPFEGGSHRRYSEVARRRSSSNQELPRLHPHLSDPQAAPMSGATLLIPTRSAPELLSPSPEFLKVFYTIPTSFLLLPMRRWNFGQINSST
jgi:hypothetical protein